MTKQHILIRSFVKKVPNFRKENRKAEKTQFSRILNAEPFLDVLRKTAVEILKQKIKKTLKLFLKNKRGKQTVTNSESILTLSCWNRRQRFQVQGKSLPTSKVFLKYSQVPACLKVRRILILCSNN